MIRIFFLFLFLPSLCLAVDTGAINSKGTIKGTSLTGTGLVSCPNVQTSSGGLLSCNNTSYLTSAVTSIATTSPITGGTITSTGTIAINNAAADGSTKGAASFTAADFDASSGNISLDYTNGQKATGSVPGFATTNQTIGGFEFIVDGGGSAITTGAKGDLEALYSCTINRATLLADQSGSCVVNVWKKAYALDSPPTVTQKITASAPPTLSSHQSSQDSTLTGWTTSVTAGDILRFNVDSCSTITRVTLSLKCTRS